jgi:hypothetical protein
MSQDHWSGVALCIESRTLCTSPPSQLRAETNPIAETLCFIFEYESINKIQRPACSNPKFCICVCVCLCVCVEKGPAADATNASQRCGFLCNPVMKMVSFFFSFFRVMEHRWNGIDKENRSTRGKTWPSATLSSRKGTWTHQGSKPGFRG